MMIEYLHTPMFLRLESGHHIDEPHSRVSNGSKPIWFLIGSLTIILYGGKFVKPTSMGHKWQFPFALLQ